ncbi:MAG: glycogen debranching enzyme N-terminal domain-containing protein [Candidatus Micrarchaeota archaeon]|nr:glycogen debranching enzyme N-terminal domain-containing protein [Candidatus Micrarchaeota archaeon]
MISLSAFDLTPSQAKGKEWLVANGLGGYSSSTVIGMNTRKYHGLLVAPIGEAHSRHVMLSKFEEFAKVGGSEYPLSTNCYPGVVYPEGFRHQIGFSFYHHPTFLYSLGDVRLEKSVRMVHGKNTALVSYRVLAGKEVELSARPLLAPRQIHSDPSAIEPALEFECDRAGFLIRKPSEMRVCASGGRFVQAREVYRNMEYRAEKERGYPYIETLCSPGLFLAKLCKGDELHISISLEMLLPSDALELLDRQALRSHHFAEQYCQQNKLERTDFLEVLLHAADTFIAKRGKGHGILAGYHWFSEWGRDAMIALPGLLLCTGRHGLAAEVLLRYASLMREGLVPNFIDESGQAHYNCADASLWFVNSVREYVEYTNDYWTVENGLWKHLCSFVSSYMHGNRLAYMDADCLLSVKEPAATWMDAKVNGVAVTPRNGKPVEINALWYSNLCFLRELAKRFDDGKREEAIAKILEGVESSFQKFCADDGGLFDVIEPNDASVRPNQIFAASLPHSPLNPLQRKYVLHVVRSRLYTPLGLRTLSPADPRYKEHYAGSQQERDVAYHQGMVWPWLLGAFYDAQLSVYPGSEAQVLASLRPFADAIRKGCIGSLPELYEPATMEPRGAISQAWSVAEILRIYTKVKKSAGEVAEKKQLAAGEKARA